MMATSPNVGSSSMTIEHTFPQNTPPHGADLYSAWTAHSSIGLEGRSFRLRLKHLSEATQYFCDLRLECSSFLPEGQTVNVAWSVITQSGEKIYGGRVHKMVFDLSRLAQSLFTFRVVRSRYRNGGQAQLILNEAPFRIHLDDNNMDEDDHADQLNGLIDRLEQMNNRDNRRAARERAARGAPWGQGRRNGGSHGPYKYEVAYNTNNGPMTACVSNLTFKVVITVANGIEYDGEPVLKAPRLVRRLERAVQETLQRSSLGGSTSAAGEEPEEAMIELVSAQGRAFPIHRLIAQQIPAWASSIDGQAGYSESAKGRIQLEFASATIEALIVWLYTGRVDQHADVDVVGELLAASNMYLLDDLKKTATRRAIEMVSENTCVCFLIKAESFRSQPLKRRCLEEIAQKVDFAKVVTSPEFAALQREHELLAEVLNYLRHYSANPGPVVVTGQQLPPRNDPNRRSAVLPPHPPDFQDVGIVESIQ